MNRANIGGENIRRFQTVSVLETEHRIFISRTENSSAFFGVSDLNLKPVYVMNPAGLRFVGLESLEFIFRLRPNKTSRLTIT